MLYDIYLSDSEIKEYSGNFIYNNMNEQVDAERYVQNMMEAIFYYKKDTYYYGKKDMYTAKHYG